MKESTVLFLRGVYKRLFPIKEMPVPPCEKNKDKIQSTIKELIESGKPLMVARFGSIELTSLENALYIKEKRSIWNYICWRGEPNYLHETQASFLCNNAGFFPYAYGKNNVTISRTNEGGYVTSGCIR